MNGGGLGWKLRFDVKMAGGGGGTWLWEQCPLPTLWVYSLRRLVSPGGWDSRTGHAPPLGGGGGLTTQPFQKGMEALQKSPRQTCVVSLDYSTATEDLICNVHINNNILCVVIYSCPQRPCRGPIKKKIEFSRFLCFLKMFDCLIAAISRYTIFLFPPSGGLLKRRPWSQRGVAINKKHF